MTTTSTEKPGFGDNWSSFGAIVFVSLLGPTLIILLAAALYLAAGAVPVILDFTLCKHVDFCGNLPSEGWSSRLYDEEHLLYVFWSTLATGFACFATLEAAFHVFPRAAPMPVLVWHAALVLGLGTYFPSNLLGSFLSVGWAGTGLVSAHYYASFRALPFYQPPEAAAGNAQEDSVVSREMSDSTEIPGGPGPRQRWALRIFALYTAAIVCLGYYVFVTDMPMLFITCCGASLYCGLTVLHGIMSSWNAQTLTIGHAGLNYRGQNLSWAEIGRAWAGTGRHRHLVAIETSESAAKRMLQATTWVNRLFEKAEVARGKADTAAHSVVIDMRFLLGAAAELVQAIEAHRPPGSRWMPTAEVS